MATLLGPESPWRGGKKRSRNRNIVTRIRHSQIAGRGFSRGTQVNERVCAADTEKPQVRDPRLWSEPSIKTCFKLRNKINQTGVKLNFDLEVV